MEYWWGPVAFSPGPPKTNLSNLERKWERKEGLYCKGQFCPLFTLEVSSSSSSSSSSSFLFFFSIFVNQNLHGQITNVFFFLPTFSTIHLGFFFLIFILTNLINHIIYIYIYTHINKEK